MGEMEGRDKRGRGDEIMVCPLRRAREKKGHSYRHLWLSEPVRGLAVSVPFYAADPAPLVLALG